MKFEEAMSTRKLARAFSLVEVVMAIGLVSFSMLSILALLPIGLNAVREASTQFGIANICNEIRADVQQIPFASVSTLSGQTYYYNQSSQRMASFSADTFYTASFQISQPSVPGGSSSYGSSASTIRVTVSYPANVPTSRQKKAICSILVAKQSNN